MRASEINPTAESLYKIGFYYKEMDDFEKAADHLSQAIQLDPKHVNAHFLLGYVMVELGEYEEALEAFSTCLSIREINHKAYYGRGYTHELMGNFDAARQDFAEALRKNPEHQPSQDGIRRLQTRR
jgi:tetratricopeptide (TPR) repeat protein